MTLQLWLGFAASAVLLVIPGPTILTVISYAVAHGRRANVALIAAVALGDSTALVVSLVGVGALLATSPRWFTIVAWVGGIYLLYLGLKLLRAGFSSAQPPDAVTRGPVWRVFVNTYVVTALNPKGIVFFLAFLPQFLNAQAPVGRQLWILAVTFVVLATLNATLYASFAAAARRMLGSPRAHRPFNLAGGLLLSLAGVWALLAKRP